MEEITFSSLDDIIRIQNSKANIQKYYVMAKQICEGTVWEAGNVFEFSFYPGIFRRATIDTAIFQLGTIVNWLDSIPLKWEGRTIPINYRNTMGLFAVFEDCVVISYINRNTGDSETKPYTFRKCKLR